MHTNFQWEYLWEMEYLEDLRKEGCDSADWIQMNQEIEQERLLRIFYWKIEGC
jgi:hypothetical protein